MTTSQLEELERAHEDWRKSARSGSSQLTVWILDRLPALCAALREAWAQRDAFREDEQKWRVQSTFNAEERGEARAELAKVREERDMFAASHDALGEQGNELHDTYLRAERLEDELAKERAEVARFQREASMLAEALFSATAKCARMEQERDAARAEGVREGLERAARLCSDYAGECESVDCYDAAAELFEVAQRIRALKEGK